MKKINVAIIIIFITISIFIGSHHEPWADEAQSWLIARDANVSDIIWNISRYEGTFPLWFLILKAFIISGLQYKYLYIIPIIISSIGLWVFLNKTQVPIYIKILYPFTFYIFYQYTIIARSYCLLFLAFSLWMVTYKDRFNHSLKYILNLIFFSFISMHGMLIALGFTAMFLIDIFKRKELKQNLIYFLLIGLVNFIEIIILLLPSDLYMYVSVTGSIVNNILIIIKNIILIDNIFIAIYNLISLVLLIIILFSTFKKSKDMFIIVCLLILFILFIRFAPHHLGILYLSITFGYLESYESQTVKIKKIFAILLILHLLYTIHSGINDYLKPYSGSKEMSKYIEEMNYEEMEIYAFGYNNVSILPYFDKNIFSNWENMTYYKWSINNKDWYNYCNFKYIDKSEFKDFPKYILIKYDDNMHILRIIDYIENTKKYEIDYMAKGYQFFKNFYSEKEDFILYKLK